MTTITVLSLNVPALTDNAIWFSNAADWNAYWAQSGFTANIPIADPGTYGLVKQANNSVYVDPGTTATQTITFQVDLAGNGVLTNEEVPRQASFEELKTQVAALVATVKNMRTAMVSAGILAQGQ